jgi:hypothetical protein
MKYKKMTFRLKSKKDKSKFPEMEKELSNWINEKRALGACLSGLSIKQMSLEIHKNLIEQRPFQASNGWFANFCSRRNYTMRRITSSGRDLPTNTNNIIDVFFKKCQKLIVDGFNNEQILNMNETF